MAAEPYGLSVTSPAIKQLSRLREGSAAAVVEFMARSLLDNRWRVGGELQRELVGLRSARRRAHRIVYEIADDNAVIVPRIDHRRHVYRSM